MPPMKTKIKPEFFFHSNLRVLFLVLAFLFQLFFAIFTARFLSNSSIFVQISSVFFWILGILVYTFHHNPSTRLFWLLLIILFPFFGFIIYLIWGKLRKHTPQLAAGTKARQNSVIALDTFAPKFEEIISQPNAANCFGPHPTLRNISHFLRSYYFPLFPHTNIDYFSCGEKFFPACLEDLAKAKKTIFIAFFILKDGKLWQQFFPILQQKVQQGVEVRLLIDDAGTMFLVSRKFLQDIRESGIQLEIFNPTQRHFFGSQVNYRNHQKIIVIDSTIGYTGGLNLSDEYANYTSPLGYWKDTGVRLEGMGVFGLTVTFLEMWDQTRGIADSLFLNYCPTQTPLHSKGFCHVINDGPYNAPLNPSRSLIIRMIEQAHNYVYLTTPYLIISPTLLETICQVARSGVRVVIIVPFIVDHWYVYEVTQSFFEQLMQYGVEIYRFTPGMIHAKMIVADDIHAMVSSINLDNRSFYSQYEDGVWFCHQPAVLDVKRDIEKTIAQSQRFTLEDLQKISKFQKFRALVLRIFAPLM